MANQNNPKPTLKAPPPPQRDIESELKQVRKKMEDCFFKFTALLNDKTLKANKSEASKKNESYVADQLYRAAADLEMRNQTEGLFSLAIMFLKLQLKDRDRMNDLEYKLSELEKGKAKEIKK